MLHNTLTLDKIQEMIKKKILIKQSPKKQYSHLKKESPIKLRPKQLQKSPLRKKSENQNNNIIIMNMPPASKIDFIKENLKNNPLIIRKLSHNSESNPLIFSNQKIFNGLHSSNVINEGNQLRNNFMNEKKQSFMELKRYNSLDGRPFMNDINNQSPQNISINVFRSLGPTFKQPQKNFKISVASIEFNNPSLRGLLSRRNKTPMRSEEKMKKVQFNYQRAISSSCESRKKAFQKVLDTFQLNLSSKILNFEPHNNKIEESEKFNLERAKTPREISTSSRSRIGSPKKKQKEQKQQQSCRPWSARKKTETKQFQACEEQNALQFYSINGNE